MFRAIVYFRDCCQMSYSSYGSWKLRELWKLQVYLVYIFCGPVKRELSVWRRTVSQALKTAFHVDGNLVSNPHHSVWKMFGLICVSFLFILLIYIKFLKQNIALFSNCLAFVTYQNPKQTSQKPLCPYSQPLSIDWRNNWEASHQHLGQGQERKNTYVVLDSMGLELG